MEYINKQTNKKNKMETIIKQLEKARKELALNQETLVKNGVSFFSFTMQDLVDSEEKVKDVIKTLKSVQSRQSL